MSGALDRDPAPGANGAASAPSSALKPQDPLTPAQLKSLPPRVYLDQTVVPVLLEGLKALVHERPADPFAYLAQYIVDHRDDA